MGPTESPALVGPVPVTTAPLDARADPRAASRGVDPPEAAEKCLPVVETFHSLQGEGIHTGRSAFFVRLAGCTVGCPWCDTKDSWPVGAHPERTLEHLAREAARAAAAGAAFVVITGGEPLHHDLAPLCAALEAAGTAEGTPLPVHLETSGVEPLRGRFTWITLSPKPHRPPQRSVLAACHELKVVVHGAEDLAFAEAMAAAALEARRQAEPPAGVPAPADPAAPVLLLQPGWGSARGQELAVEHVRTHPNWRLSLQTHKVLGMR